MLDSTQSIVASEVSGWATVLAGARFDATTGDVDLLALIEAAERLSAACAAVQARATHEYSERRLVGLPVGSEGDRTARREVGATIARARHESPFHGTRHLELARMLVRDLPGTLDALSLGDTTEHRAALVAKAAACLGSNDRAALDADLAPRLAGMGHCRVEGEANRLAAQLDPQSVVERHRRAVHERHVTLRPAPDTMSYLTALLPVADGVAALAALHRHAALATATGDPRGRGQVMADEMVRRLVEQPGHTAFIDRVDAPDSEERADRTSPLPIAIDRQGMGGRGAGDARTNPTRRDAARSRSAGDCDTPVGPDSTGGRTAPEPIAAATGSSGDEGDEGDTAFGLDGFADGDPVEPDTPTETDTPTGPGPTTVPATRQIDLMLVMTDRALFDGEDTPAIITGHGPIPAALARGLLADADPTTRVFLRRLYTDPGGTTLLSMDARGRVFPHAVRQFVLARDQRCRTPWCDAPIRHIDHATPHSAGGPTSPVNAEGLCERCNLTKAARTGTAVATAPAPPPPRSDPWGADRMRTGQRPVAQMSFSASVAGRPTVPAAGR